MLRARSMRSILDRLPEPDSEPVAQHYKFFVKLPDGSFHLVSDIVEIDHVNECITLTCL